jgi:hypothetical protein
MRRETDLAVRLWPGPKPGERAEPASRRDDAGHDHPTCEAPYELTHLALRRAIEIRNGGELIMPTEPHHRPKDVRDGYSNR